MEYKIIREYYNMKLFADADLALFVSCGWITQEEKQNIIKNT
ncbi:MAG: XkdX family protein [Beduini sp.]